MNGISAMIPKFPDQQQLPHSTFVLKSVPLAVGANPKGSAKDCKRLLSGLTRMALTQLLLRRSYKVITAASVAEARIVAAAQMFHVVISDIGLPDGNGYALMAELNRNKVIKGIALTGYGMQEDVERSRASGFVAHLTKPVSIQSLEAALNVVNNKAL